jgi:hypothetical protein
VEYAKVTTFDPKKPPLMPGLEELLPETEGDEEAIVAVEIRVEVIVVVAVERGAVAYSP